MIQTLFQIALGGAIGAVARYGFVLGATAAFGVAFPFGTLAVNVIGSALMGAVYMVMQIKGLTQFAPFLMTGLLGGFTTFSAFSLDAIRLIERGDIAGAGLYIGLSVALSISALVLSMWLIKGVLT